MALPKIPSLLLLVVVMATVATACAGTGGSSEQGGDAGCFAPLVGCAPPVTGATSAGNATAFRAGLASLLAALPSAAVDTGFASLRSQPAPGDAGRDSDRAHALGLCFGGAGPAPSGSACVACLSAAAAAVGEGCAHDTHRAGVWRDGCLLAYHADDNASSASDVGGFRQWLLSGDTRSHHDSLEQTLADLAMVLAKPKGQSPWKEAQSVLFFVLAAVGTVTVVLLFCVFLAGCLFAETLARNGVAAGLQRGNAGAGQGEGIAVYVAGTNGRAPVWSVAAQLRFY